MKYLLFSKRDTTFYCNDEVELIGTFSSKEEAQAKADKLGKKGAATGAACSIIEIPDKHGYYVIATSIYELPVSVDCRYFKNKDTAIGFMEGIKFVAESDVITFLEEN